MSSVLPFGEPRRSSFARGQSACLVRTPGRRTPPSQTANAALGALRSQAAFFRTLLDELERLTSSAGGQGLSEHIVEELARLGCRSLGAASELTLVIGESRRSA